MTTTAKARVAAIIQIVTQVLSAALLITLPDNVRAWVVVALQIVGAVGTVVGVYKVPNQPIP